MDDTQDKDIFGGATQAFPFTVTLYALDGSAAAFAEDDVIHFALSERERGEPTTELLAIDSEDYTANESKVEITSRGVVSPHTAATGYVRFGQDDLDAIIADWSADELSKRLVGEMWFVDSAETHPTNAKKYIKRWIIHLHRSAAQ
jgi:hypothetical protein